MPDIYRNMETVRFNVGMKRTAGLTLVGVGAITSFVAGVVADENRTRAIIFATASIASTVIGTYLTSR